MAGYSQTVCSRYRTGRTSTGHGPWEVDASGHPDSGRREAPDEMLGIIGAMYIPEGRQPARETVHLGMDVAVHVLMGAGAEAVGGDFNRVVLAHWRAPYGRLTWRLERAFEHPTLGYGVRSRLVVDLDRERCVPSHDLAQRLNSIEGTVAQALIGGGAWAVSEGEEPRSLIYTAFFPNAGLRGGLAPMIASNAWFRAEWLGSVLGETSAMVGAT